MNAISRKKHEALIAAMQQLLGLLQSDSPGDGRAEVNKDIDAVREGLIALTDSYARYEHLLEELATEIAFYTGLNQHLRVEVLVGNLRRLQKLLDPETPEYQLLKDTVGKVKAI